MVSSINGINSNLEYSLQSSQSKAQQTEFDELLKQAGEQKDSKKLMETCRNLESVFVNMMFKQMQSTLSKTSLTDGGFAENMYNDMLTEQYSNEATKGKGLGLAQIMYKQLSKNNTDKSEG
jgi:flagellar protein FlgJ